MMKENFEWLGKVLEWGEKVLNDYNRRCQDDRREGVRHEIPRC